MSDRSDELVRRVLWSLPNGLYVLGSTGSADRGPWNLMTTSQVTQVASEPRTLALSVEVGSRTSALLEASGSLALSLLDRADRALVRRFVKPVDELELDAEGRPTTMAGEQVVLLANGAPRLEVAVAWLELKVAEVLARRSHLVVLADVVSAGAPADLLEGSTGRIAAEVLRMEDTRMRYGG